MSWPVTCGTTGAVFPSVTSCKPSNGTCWSEAAVLSRLASVGPFLPLPYCRLSHASNTGISCTWQSTVSAGHNLSTVQTHFFCLLFTSVWRWNRRLWETDASNSPPLKRKEYERFDEAVDLLSQELYFLLLLPVSYCLLPSIHCLRVFYLSSSISTRPVRKQRGRRRWQYIHYIPFRSYRNRRATCSTEYFSFDELVCRLQDGKVTNEWYTVLLTLPYV